MSNQISLQRVDPLGAFAGRRLTLAAAAAVVSFAVVLTAVSTPVITNPPAAGAAIALAVVTAGILVARSSHRRGLFSRTWALAAFGFALAADLAAQIGTSGGQPAVNWGPYVLALLLLALVPYRPVREIVTLTIAAGVWVVAGAAITHADDPLFGLVALQALAPVLALPLGGAAFADHVLQVLHRWRANALESDSEEARRQEVAITRAVQRSRVSILNREVVPFFADLVAREQMTDADVQRARQLADSIRAVMLADNDRTWLDELMSPTPDELGAVLASAVDDPGRLASFMDLDQRAALRALIAALRERSAGSDDAVMIILEELDEDCEVRLTARAQLSRRGGSLRPYLAVMSTVFTQLSYRIRDGKLTMRFCYERP